jgi:hypothetical protein
MCQFYYVYCRAMTSYLRSSASSFPLVISASSNLALRFNSTFLAILLASEWARWFVRIARSSAALRDKEEV